MGIMSKYERHIEGVLEREDRDYIIEDVEQFKYIPKEELMLRGNNRKNTYSRERVRIGANVRTRKYNDYRR